MKKNLKKLSDILKIKYKNPSSYQIDQDKAEIIWKVLMESGNKKEAQILSKLMIQQGCEGINIENPELILMFWKDYLEENDILCFRPADELH